MSKHIKFNVIIPTRERADTLYHCLRTIVSQKYDNLDIIVSDNYSQDNTREIVASFSDSRIKYINTGKRISMSHNYAFALNHVSDGWVTIIGDDDGLLPGALAKIANVIQKMGCKAVASKWCYYYWPHCTAQENHLIVPLKSGIELRNGREWLGKLMRGDAVYPDLPFLYTGGFVDIEAINRARDGSGSFFLSMTPDVYSAIALASVLDSYVMLMEPVTVGGVSTHSTGASCLGVGDNIKPSNMFFSEGNIPFHHTLVGGEVVKSIPIIVYESYLQAIHLHHDYLGIRLEDQLGLALANISPQYYDNLRRYCTEIAFNNKILMSDVDRKFKVFNRKFKKRELLRLILWFIRPEHLDFDGNELGLQNVFDAALVANAVLVSNKTYQHRKRKMILSLIKKIAQRVSDIVRRK